MRKPRVSISVHPSFRKWLRRKAIDYDMDMTEFSKLIGEDKNNNIAFDINIGLYNDKKKKEKIFW